MTIEEFKKLNSEEKEEYGESLPLGSTYDENGNNLIYKTNDGYWRENTYNDKGNKLTYKDSFGCWCESTYDKNGDLLAFRDNNEWYVVKGKDVSEEEYIKFIKEIKWKQEISEYVGKGHPDRVADEIAAIINSYASTSATEVIVNKAGVYLSGETNFRYPHHKHDAISKVRHLIKLIGEDYNREEYINIFSNFIIQDLMLSDRKKAKLAGDQEIVYHHELNENDVHFHLREIDRLINKTTQTLDYKTIINMKNKTFGLSITNSHKESKWAIDLIVEEAKERFGEDIDIRVTSFEGGSIFNDTGVTGRKLIVEQAGCGYPHGGGAVYGKDITKTAPYGHKLARESGLKNIVVTYRPGDNLDKPTYIGEINV